MAAFKAIAGSQAPFYVVPLLGGVVVVATFLLGKLLFDEVVGLAAAALMAASPAFLFQLMFPMSDVPVAAAWTVALVLAVSEMPFAAGLVSGFAVLIRPNLPLLAIAVGFIAASPAISRDAVAPTLRRTLTFGIGLLPAVVGVAVLYCYLTDRRSNRATGRSPPFIAWSTWDQTSVGTARGSCKARRYL